MKLLCRLTIILALCLMAVPSLPLPAAAETYPPVIGLSPNQGIPGDTVTVTGNNFTAGEWVRVYYYLDGEPVTEVGEPQVEPDRSFGFEFAVPDSYSGTHSVRAYIADSLQAITTFEVQRGLTVAPEEGQVGDTVTVTGRGYGTYDIRLYFGPQRVLEDVTIEADGTGRWEHDFEIPPSVRGSHDIDTTPPAARDATFTVGPGVRLEPDSGSPGQTIAMTGGGFGAGERNITILFDGEELETGIEAGNRGQWEESFDVPEMPAGEYEVTAEGPQTKDAPGRTFEIVPGIEISPNEGHVGINVTATGRGFAASINVTILYEEQEVATTFTNEQGSFEVMFPVPESRFGEREVTAEDGEGNKTEVPAIFTMESVPPSTPELYYPIDGQRVGFARSVRPAFEWEEVFDLSGVYYSLQISTSANVTDKGYFVDPVLTWEGLTGNYTLERDEGLPHGTYYWIVQAVDGAQNESGWSDPESFRAGRLPLWALIVIIVIVVLGAGGAGYYFKTRRRMYD